MTEAGHPTLPAILVVHARYRRRAREDAAVSAEIELVLFPSCLGKRFGLSVIEAFAAGTRLLAIYNYVLAAACARLIGPVPAARGSG